MKAASLQPSAGTQSELTGMLMIHAYHAHKGKQRKKVIMPSTAHGTNPASAAICGYTPVPVELNKDGIVTPESIREIMDEDTAGIMLTNPNTLEIQLPATERRQNRSVSKALLLPFAYCVTSV